MLLAPSQIYFRQKENAMPKAVDSNSTIVPKIHPAYLLNNLSDLSRGLKACKLILANLPEANCDFKAASIGVSIMLESVAKQVNRLSDDMTQLIHQYPQSIKILRDEFIIEKQQQGISVREISQALNMPVKTVEGVLFRQMT